MWLLWALVVDRDLLKDTHTWMASNPRQQTCFYFFMPQKSFNKPFEFVLYKTNRLHFSVCVYCNRSQKTSQHVKNSDATRLRVVLFCSLHAVTSSVIYYSTHPRKNVIYLSIVNCHWLENCVYTFYTNRNIKSWCTALYRYRKRSLTFQACRPFVREKH